MQAAENESISTGFVHFTITQGPTSDAQYTQSAPEQRKDTHLTIAMQKQQHHET